MKQNFNIIHNTCTHIQTDRQTDRHTHKLHTNAVLHTQYTCIYKPDPKWKLPATHIQYVYRSHTIAHIPLTISHIPARVTYNSTHPSTGCLQYHTSLCDQLQYHTSQHRSPTIAHIPAQVTYNSTHPSVITYNSTHPSVINYNSTHPSAGRLQQHTSQRMLPTTSHIPV